MTPLEALEALGDGPHTALAVANRMGIAYNDRAGWKAVRDELNALAAEGRCARVRDPANGVRFEAVKREARKADGRGRPPTAKIGILRRMESGPAVAAYLDQPTLRRCVDAGLCAVDGSYASITEAGREFLERWAHVRARFTLQNPFKTRFP